MGFDLIVFVVITAPLALIANAWWRLHKEPLQKPVDFSRVILVLVSTSAAAFYVIAVLGNAGQMTASSVSPIAGINFFACLGLSLLSTALAYWKRYRQAIAPSLCLCFLWLILGCMH